MELGKLPRARLGTATIRCLARLWVPVADAKLQGTSPTDHAQLCTAHPYLRLLPLMGGSWELVVRWVGVKNPCLL